MTALPSSPAPSKKSAVLPTDAVPMRNPNVTSTMRFMGSCPVSSLAGRMEPVLFSNSRRLSAGKLRKRVAFDACRFVNPHAGIEHGHSCAKPLPNRSYPARIPRLLPYQTGATVGSISQLFSGARCFNMGEHSAQQPRLGAASSPYIGWLETAANGGVTDILAPRQGVALKGSDPTCEPCDSAEFCGRLRGCCRCRFSGCGTQVTGRPGQSIDSNPYVAMVLFLLGLPAVRHGQSEPRHPHGRRLDARLSLRRHQDPLLQPHPRLAALWHRRPARHRRSPEAPGTWTPTPPTSRTTTRSFTPATTRWCLKNYGITAELTSTTRVGFHRYQFPERPDAAR